MAIQTIPEVEPPPTENRSRGGWLGRLLRRVRLALGGDDELLLIENATAISWRVYHDYHQLTILDAGEEQVFHLVKHGTLNMRPCSGNEGESVEYLVTPLAVHVQRVRIYRRQLSKELEVYDLRVA